MIVEENKSNFLEIWHGTTTLAFIVRSGIIISVDSRASMGKYIGSGNVKKVIPINEYLLGTMAGGAADCFFWERNLGMMCNLYELQNNHRISTAGASKIFANIIYKYKNSGLSIGAMIIGWDQTGPGLFYVDSNATRIKTKMISVGSGSTFAYGILDANYDPKLSIIKSLELGKMAIFQAAFKDAYSGGKINSFVMKKEGWIKVSSEDIGIEVFDKYK